MTTTPRPGSLLAQALAQPAPVRQPRRAPATARVRLPEPVSCGHPGGRRTIAFGPNGGRIDRCTDCVKLSDRTMRHEESWLADPDAEAMRKRMQRGTHFIDPFQKRYRDPVAAAEDERDR